MMNAIVQADPRLRKRAIAVVSITLLVGLAYLVWFQGFVRELEALATASPQLAFEKLNPVRIAALGVVLCSSTALAGLLAYVALRVFRAGQWPPPGWRVVYNMSIRTGRQATVVTVFMLLLALAALVYGAVIVSLPGPVPEEQIEVPMKSVQAVSPRATTLVAKTPTLAYFLPVAGWPGPRPSTLWFAKNGSVENLHSQLFSFLESLMETKRGGRISSTSAREN